MYEEFQTEVENRVRNLMWTVSEDYKLDSRVDTSSYFRSRYISLYDAVKQGAFARYYDKDLLGMYMIRKIYYGADETALTEFAQLCVDSAIQRRISAERPGIPDLRRHAFEDVLDLFLERMNGTLTGRLKIILLRGYLDGRWDGEQRLAEAADRIRALEESTDTMELIRTVDVLYNTLIDRNFEKKHGNLEYVMSTSLEDLKDFNWKDYLEQESLEEFLEEYMRQLNSRVVSIDEKQEEESEESSEGRGRKVVVIDEEAAAKMHHYMELNYGVSYLSEREQKSINQRLCRGTHADCSLYFTDGILENPVLANAQYVNAKRHAEKNKVLYRNSHYMVQRNVELLTAELGRSLQRRNEPEEYLSDTGTVLPRRLWRVGRCERPGKLFEKTDYHHNSDFVVDILMDASGSQRDRQGQVALQALIISESLSNIGIPHRIMSFCSFWDYTVMQRFREYDDPRSENFKILNYTTSANNRDGLAFRAAGDSLLARPEEGKILIVLSDGRPNDVIVNRPNSRNPEVYCGDYAVNDTALEVRKLRGNGVFVLGVFAGKEADLHAEKKIFGKDFAFIRNIENFSKVTGRFLRKLLEEE